jgi:dienelactone hydrolase
VASRRRTVGTWLAGAALLAVLAALALAIRFGPALTLALALARPTSETWLAPFLPDPVREEITLVADDRWIRADLYRPVRPRAAWLLVHGLSPAGRRHPELARLARLLAKHGQLVLVPELEGLAAFRLSGAEVGAIRSAVHYLATRSAVVGLAGFSFGAGPALLAAADLPDVRLVASFGGYAELAHVVAYISTGVHAFGGRRYVQPPEEYNRWKLLALLVGFVEDGRDRELLGAVAERKLGNPAADTTAIEASLGGEGRAVLALARNRREDRVDALLAGLPPRAREALARLSPLSAVPRIRGRLLIAHGEADDSIPFTESLRLAAAAGGRARVVILHTFHHTGPRPFWRSLRERGEDAWNLVGLADDLVRLR